MHQILQRETVLLGIRKGAVGSRLIKASIQVEAVANVRNDHKRWGFIQRPRIPERLPAASVIARFNLGFRALRCRPSCYLFGALLCLENEATGPV